MSYCTAIVITCKQVKPIAEKSLEAYKLTASDMEKRPHHIFHLHYPVFFYNMLPISITVNTTSVSTH